MIYRWNDEVIHDIRAWARTRGEKMVEYKKYRDRPDPLAKRTIREVEYGEMPESFFSNLRSGGEEGWLYQAMRSYRP